MSDTDLGGGGGIMYANCSIFKFAHGTRPPWPCLLVNPFVAENEYYLGRGKQLQPTGANTSWAIKEETI